MTDPPGPAEELTPEEIWARCSNLQHRTFLALARKARDDEESEGEGEARFDLTPIVGDIEPATITFVLRATGRFQEHYVRFEEAAIVKFEEETTLSTDEVQSFGSTYIVPFLLPFVEVGFARMCSEVREKAPRFPFVVVSGRVFADDKAQIFTDQDSEEPQPSILDTDSSG